MSPEVEYLRARYAEEQVLVDATKAEDLYRLPTLECGKGHRIYLGIGLQQQGDLAAKQRMLALHDQWFGADPPATPIIWILLQAYAWRDDFDPTWKV